MTERIVIVQPYVPKYRVGFFEGLVCELERDGIDCVVAAGRPTGNQKFRADAIPARAWMRTYEPRRIALGGRALDFGGATKAWTDASAVILGLQGTLLDTYRALLRRDQRKVGLWGHVDSYVSPSHPLDHALERWQARNADHIFAYTPSGANEAVRMGVSQARITTVMNSMDTEGLIEQRSRLTASTIKKFTSKHQLVAGKTLAFVGGIDASKRIDLLAEALDILWLRDPQIRVLVGGQGASVSLLDRSVARGQATLLGYADDRLLALILSVSEAIVVPGRIGLVAVQALAWGLPILTTEYRFHAPEFEYLKHGQSVHVSEETALGYANLITARLSTARRRNPESTSYPSLSSMVSNFADGVRTMLNTR